MKIYGLEKELQNFVNYVLNTGISREKYVSIALGKALADSFSLAPYANVPDDVLLSSYLQEVFENNIKINALLILNDINESMLINIDDVIYWTSKFVIFKLYSMVPLGNYSTSRIYITKEEPVYDLLGVSEVFSVDDRNYIKDSWDKLNRVLTGCYDLIKYVSSANGD